MELFKNSLFCALLLSFCRWFYGRWEESNIASLVRRFYGWVQLKWRSSFLFSLAVAGKNSGKAWESSAAVRIMNGVFNLVPSLLGKIRVAAESFFVEIFGWLGEHAAMLVSLIVLLMLIVPQQYWNNVYSLALLAAVLLLFWLGSVKNGSLRLDFGKVGFFAVLYALFAIISFFTSQYISLSFRFFLFHITCMLAVLLTVSSVSDEEKLERMILCIFVGLLVAGVYGLIQKAMGIEVDEKLVDLSTSSDTPGRVFSFFENPNSYAMILVLFLPLTAVGCIYFSGAKRLVSLAALLIGGLNLALTYSRGGWISIVLAAFLLMLIMWPRFVPLLIVLCIAALPLLPSTIYNRLLSILNYSSDSSVTSRGALYKVMWELIKAHPLRGYGLGSDVIQQAVADSGLYASEMDFIHGHDLYLQVAGEMGVFGLAALIGTFVEAFRNGGRIIAGKSGSRTQQGIIAALISGFAGVLCYGIIDYPWYYPRVMVIFWAGFGLLSAAIALANDK